MRRTFLLCLFLLFAFAAHGEGAKSCAWPEKCGDISAGGTISDGNSLCIEGADGDVCMSVDDVNNRLTITGPSGYEASLFGSLPMTNADILRRSDSYYFHETVDITSMNSESPLKSFNDATALTGVSPVAYATTTGYKFVTPLSTVAPAVVVSLSCMWTALSGFTAGADLIDICPFAAPAGHTQTDVRNGVYDLATCMRVSDTSTDCDTDTASVGFMCTTAINETVADEQTNLGLRFANAVDADVSADMGGVCWLTYTGEPN